MGVLCVKSEKKDIEKEKMHPIKGVSPLNTIQTKMGIFR
jgi:hypothetical protein